MPIRVAGRSGVVLNVAVQVETLRIAEIGIGYVDWLLGPVRRHEPAERGSIVPSTELIQAALGVPFFAGTT
jgi:hypothetical protein